MCCHKASGGLCKSSAALTRVPSVLIERKGNPCVGGWKEVVRRTDL